MFRSLFKSKWSKITVPEIWGQSGCVTVTITNLECEKHISGKYRLVNDWGAEFVQWLSSRWKHEDNQPASSPYVAEVSIPGYQACIVALEVSEFADKQQLISDALDAIIEGLQSLGKKSK